MLYVLFVFYFGKFFEAGIYFVCKGDVVGGGVVDEVYDFCGSSADGNGVGRGTRTLDALAG